MKKKKKEKAEVILFILLLLQHRPRSETLKAIGLVLLDFRVSFRRDTFFTGQCDCLLGQAPVLIRNPCEKCGEVCRFLWRLASQVIILTLDVTEEEVLRVAV